MSTAAPAAGSMLRQPSVHRGSLLPVGLIALVCILLAIGMLSLRVGSLGITTADAWNALFHYNPDNYAELVVRTLRLPRTCYAIVLGAGLGIQWNDCAGGHSQSARRPLDSGCFERSHPRSCDRGLFLRTRRAVSICLVFVRGRLVRVACWFSRCPRRDAEARLPQKWRWQAS